MNKTTNPMVKYSDDQEELLKDKNYKKYYRKKLRLKKKHNFDYHHNVIQGRVGNRYKEGEREQFLLWIKESMDLMLTPEGDFQKFLWENRSHRQMLKEDRYAYFSGL